MTENLSFITEKKIVENQLTVDDIYQIDRCIESPLNQQAPAVKSEQTKTLEFN